LHNHNEQFFQVGLLDRALISLGLALSPKAPLYLGTLWCYVSGLVRLALYLVH